MVQVGRNIIGLLILLMVMERPITETVRLLRWDSGQLRISIL